MRPTASSPMPFSSLRASAGLSRWMASTDSMIAASGAFGSTLDRLFRQRDCLVEAAVADQRDQRLLGQGAVARIGLQGQRQQIGRRLHVAGIDRMLTGEIETGRRPTLAVNRTSAVGDGGMSALAGGQCRGQQSKHQWTQRTEKTKHGQYLASFHREGIRPPLYGCHQAFRWQPPPRAVLPGTEPHG